MQRVYIAWIRFLWTFSMSRSHRVQQQYFWRSLRSLSLFSNWGNFFSQKQISEHLCKWIHVWANKIQMEQNQVDGLQNYQVLNKLQVMEAQIIWAVSCLISDIQHHVATTQWATWPENSFLKHESHYLLLLQWAWSERARQLSNQQKITL